MSLLLMSRAVDHVANSGVVHVVEVLDHGRISRRVAAGCAAVTGVGANEIGRECLAKAAALPVAVVK